MDSPDMPKLDLAKDKLKLSISDLHYIKKIQEANADRVAKLKKVRKNNLISACVLGTAVFSIYAYTILAVKQEKFLDDFEIPATTVQKQ